jgi:hypothetical protein
MENSISKLITLIENKGIAELILDLDNSELGLRSIAKRFNTSKSTVEKIKKNLNGFLVVDSNHKKIKINGKWLEYNCGTLEMSEHTIAKFN